MLCEYNYCITEMFFINDEEKSTWYKFILSGLTTLIMFLTKTFLFDRIYLSMLAKMACFCYNLPWNIVLLQVNIKFTISFFLHSCKTFSLLICHNVATPMQRLILRLFQHMWIPNPKGLEIMLMHSFNHIFSVLFNAYSNLHKLHLKSEIWSSHSVGEGVFYGPSVWPDIFALFPLASRKANVNNLSVSALGSLSLPAIRYVSAAQSWLAFGFPSGFPFVSLWCDQGF